MEAWFQQGHALGRDAHGVVSLQTQTLRVTILLDSHWEVLCTINPSNISHQLAKVILIFFFTSA
jgi:hypothetical protein